MSGGIAAERLISTDLLTEQLVPDEGSAGLGTASRALGAFAASELGLWEAGPGQDDDAESDELFLVLAGAGTLEFEDGSTIQLRPGVLVRLRAGDRTTWHLAQRLRKLYLA